MTLQALLLYFLIDLIVISVLGIITYLIYQFTHLTHLNLKQIFNFITATFMSIIRLTDLKSDKMKINQYDQYLFLFLILIQMQTFNTNIYFIYVCF